VSATLAGGTRLGPYEIQNQIGAGGMGEVYRARDSRLGRDVAVKVLPAALAGDEDRLRRFEREARAAGQLNHPNIMAVHDVGTTDALTPYIVCELLEGATLRTRLGGGPIPPRKAIQYAIQIAKGLAAAHAKGIAHRDLKPENVMILGGDHVKILDFGLAKLLHVERASDDDTGTLHTNLTMTGAVLGTASYMSPEQVRQQETDHRTDIFTLGAILYEMLAGRRAFEGASHADRMSAILQSEPPPLPGEIEAAAPGVGAIIAHCLEKAASDRFDTARDLAFALSLVDANAAHARRAGAGAGDDRAAQPAPAAGEPEYSQVTFRDGTVHTARFAPDGQAICYGAAWEGRETELFWAYPGNPEPRALGHTRTNLLAIASSGEMAVSLRHQSRGGFVFTGMLARMPLGGGAPREMMDGVWEADWSPDGRRLAIIREEAGMVRIEYSAGTVLYQTAGWVGDIRVSPDGTRIAFFDHPARGDDSGSVAVVDLNRNVKHLSSGWLSARGLAWSPDGREILFTAYQTGAGRALHAVDLDGTQRGLLQAPGRLTLMDISRQGTVLMALEQEGIRTQFIENADSPHRDLTWLDWTRLRALTPDGSRILFDETGVGGGPSFSTYVRGTDGSPAIRLGDGIAFNFSPDGQWALAGVGRAPLRLDLLPCGAGEARIIPTEAIDVEHAAWFPDGAAICCIAKEQGRGMRLYKLDPSSGKHEAFSEEGITYYDSQVSPDGKLVAAQGPDRKLTIYPVDGGAPRSIKGILEFERPISWSAEGDAIFVFTRGEMPGKVSLIDLATGQRKLWREISPSNRTGVEGLAAVRMTPDGSTLAYSYYQRLNRLFVVEGLF
jgi:Tol biopolymer transport system component